MKEEERQQRHEAISAAAYEQLARHGYGGASMLRIARAARASNETLYRWYGDKDGLFTAMARDNAAKARLLLEAALEGRGEPMADLDRVAPVFLEMLLGERAVLLNRAAAADPSGRLGAAISAGGRREIAPLFARLMRRVCAGRSTGPEEAADWFLSLLIGDRQVKRIITEIPAPAPAEIEARCRRALFAFRRLIEARR
ncbi:MAG: TetR/AcrR family transcriptional regulator [Pikeienuella sp.]